MIPGRPFQAAIRAKILAGIIVFTLLITLSAVWVIHVILGRLLLQELQQRGVSIATEIAQQSLTALVTEDFIHLGQQIGASRQAHSGVVYIFVIDQVGAVAAHTFEGGFPADLVGLNPPGGAAQRIESIQAGEELLYDIAVPVNGGGLGTVHVGISQVALRGELNRAIRLTVWLIAAILAVAIGAAFFFTARFTRPLEELAAGARRVGSGDLGEQLPIRTLDEVGQVTRAFNDMVEDLGRQREERHRVEAELRESGERLRALFEQAAVGMAEVSPDGHWLTANSTLANILGCRPEELAGRTFQESSHPEDTALSLRKRDLVASGSFDDVTFQKRFPRPDGSSVWTTVTLSAVRDTAGKVTSFIAVVENISREKAAEEEQGRMRDQIVQLQKMEAIGRLAGGVAHDFNNILTVLMGHADMAQEHLGHPLFVENSLTQMREAISRASLLTHQLLLFSRKQSIEFTTLDVNQTIEAIIRMLRRIIGVDVTIATDLAPRLWPVSGNAGGIEQVLMNLAVNARDAMPSGGSLTIKTANVTVDEEYARTSAEAVPGRFVCLSVADTGAGMDHPTLRQIFEPFFTTKRPDEGTGLGLSVVYAMVKQHGGWINVYSEPGHGATFKIYLPAAVERRGEARVESSPQPDLHGHGERILMVEDRRDIREMATEALRSGGYAVLAVASATEAREAVAREARFDLLFSDVALSDGNGIQLAGELTAADPALRVVLTSGYSDWESRWPDLLGGKHRFLQKPYAIGSLLRAVRDLLADLTGK